LRVLQVNGNLHEDELEIGINCTGKVRLWPDDYTESYEAPTYPVVLQDVPRTFTPSLEFRWHEVSADRFHWGIGLVFSSIQGAATYRVGIGHFYGPLHYHDYTDSTYYMSGPPWGNPNPDMEWAAPGEDEMFIQLTGGSTGVVEGQTMSEVADAREAEHMPRFLCETTTLEGEVWEWEDGHVPQP
jgi:hypothetical protein